eukprot:TRINITY_DN18849_c0_g1_i1.p1 TRINITY_DN18849_c0_g1~~TRINITY_DN18849_c0_g1_i1.p1  ORF type:complete len:262 (+),score=117.17 TRINITY_DN18849_c0_g1_i1:55-786(+)
MAEVTAEEAAERGLGVVFSVADDEGQTKPFAGLALLSQVCAEERVPGTHVIASQLAITAPQRRVGLRPPCSEERDKLQEIGRLLSSVADQSPRSLYQYYCAQYGTKVNSQLLRSLPAGVGEFDLSELSCAGNFVGDRGVLPLLEVVRACRHLRVLLLPDNGIKNPGVECIVHMALEHPALEDLDLSGNRITLGAGKVLHELARRNPRVCRVDVAATRIDDQLQARIQAAVKANVDRRARTRAT